MVINSRIFAIKSMINPNKIYADTKSTILKNTSTGISFRSL